jgi:hypothetical protein
MRNGVYKFRPILIYKSEQYPLDVRNSFDIQNQEYIFVIDDFGCRRFLNDILLFKYSLKSKILAETDPKSKIPKPIIDSVIDLLIFEKAYWLKSEHSI